MHYCYELWHSTEGHEVYRFGYWYLKIVGRTFCYRIIVFGLLNKPVKPSCCNVSSPDRIDCLCGDVYQ